MAMRRDRVRQGKSYGALFGAFLLASACSSDSTVSFSPTPDLSGGDGSFSGTGSTAGTRSDEEGAGARAAAGEGPDEGGTHSGGTSAGGADGAGGSSAGTVSGGSAGQETAGSGGSGALGGVSGGSGAGGGVSGSSSGGTSAGAGAGGTAGSVGSGGSGGSSDGPCTPGVFGLHTYAFCGVVENAAAAQAKCESLGLAVVSIESKVENDYVQGKQGSTWLDGTDEAEEGQWRWAATGVVFWRDKPLPGVYSNFTDGQPNNKDNQGYPENCLVLTKSGWNDVGCELAEFRATCESVGPSGPVGPFPPGFSP